MKATLEAIKARAIESIDTANDLESLDRLYVAILGRNGELTGILRSMPQLSKEERAEMGKKANIVKQEIEALFTQRRAVIAKEAQEKAFLAESVDVTCPGVKTQVIGHLHPLTKTYREIRDVLIGMGFTTFASPEVELEKYNFTMLNLPPDHPARDMQDTFYINDNVLLRTHTSPGEIRALTTLKPPFRILIPGKVFRVDEVDASHSIELFICVSDISQVIDKPCHAVSVRVGEGRCLSAFERHDEIFRVEHVQHRRDGVRDKRHVARGIDDGTQRSLHLGLYVALDEFLVASELCGVISADALVIV